MTTTQAAASLNHRFNRLTMQLRGGVTDIAYGATQDDTGQRDRSARPQPGPDRAGRALRYDCRSAVGVFAETTLIQRSYGAPADGRAASAIPTASAIASGLAFLPTHPRLRGEVSLGWGTPAPRRSRRCATVDGLLIDANLVWRMTPLTSLLFSARSDIVDSVTESVEWRGDAHARRSKLRQGLRRYLTATAGLQADDQRLSRHRPRRDGDHGRRLGLEYAISREIQLFSRYEHIWFDTTEPAGDWQADEVRVGMRLRH